MTPQENIGKDMKKARKKTGLTQAQVAEKVGINVNYYARIERGVDNPSLETLKTISKILKVRFTI